VISCFVKYEKKSVQSCPESGLEPIAVIGEVDETSSDSTPMGARKRTARTFTGVKEERLNALIRSRSGLVASMTRFQWEIQTLIEENGESSLVVMKLTTYNHVWIKYVNVHGNIIQLLDSEKESLKACSHYEDQRNKKVNLELLVSSWRRMAEERSDELKKRQ